MPLCIIQNYAIFQNKVSPLVLETKIVFTKDKKMTVWEKTTHLRSRVHLNFFLVCMYILDLEYYSQYGTPCTLSSTVLYYLREKLR